MVKTKHEFYTKVFGNDIFSAFLLLKSDLPNDLCIHSSKCLYKSASFAYFGRGLTASHSFFCPGKAGTRSDNGIDSLHRAVEHRIHSDKRMGPVVGTYLNGACFPLIVSHN